MNTEILTGALGFVIGRDSSIQNASDDQIIYDPGYISDLRYLQDAMDEDSFRILAKRIMMLTWLNQALRLQSQIVDVKHNQMILNILSCFIKNIPSYKYFLFESRADPLNSDMFGKVYDSKYITVKYLQNVTKSMGAQAIIQALMNYSSNNYATLSPIYKLDTTDYRQVDLFNPVSLLSIQNRQLIASSYELIQVLKSSMDVTILSMVSKCNDKVKAVLNDERFQLTCGLSLDLSKSEFFFSSNFKTIYNTL